MDLGSVSISFIFSSKFDFKMNDKLLWGLRLYLLDFSFELVREQILDLKFEFLPLELTKIHLFRVTQGSLGRFLGLKNPLQPRLHGLEGLLSLELVLGSGLLRLRSMGLATGLDLELWERL